MKSPVPHNKSLYSKEKYLLEEVRKRTRWQLKLSAPAPSEAEMQSLVRLANESCSDDKNFIFFIRRFIEAQGDYAAKRRLREKVRIKALRLPAESAKVVHRHQAALESFAHARQTKKDFQAEEAELTAAENNYAALKDDVGRIRLVREILSGGAEDDPHAWRLNFPVGSGQADVPYELHLHIRENRVVGEIAPRRIEDAFAPGLGLTDERAKYVKILMRMALHGSLKRLNRCIACGEFTLKKRSRKHSYCSKACEREYDSELKRPNEVQRELAKRSQQSRYELENSRSWKRKSEREKLEAISQTRFRDRTYRG